MNENLKQNRSFPVEVRAIQIDCLNNIKLAFFAFFGQVLLTVQPKKRIDEPLLCSMVLEIQSLFRSTVRLVFFFLSNSKHESHQSKVGFKNKEKEPETSI